MREEMELALISERARLCRETQLQLDLQPLYIAQIIKGDRVPGRQDAPRVFGIITSTYG